jgi:hypothetical protein
MPVHREAEEAELQKLTEEEREKRKEQMKAQVGGNCMAAGALEALLGFGTASSCLPPRQIGVIQYHSWHRMNACAVCVFRR